MIKSGASTKLILAEIDRAIAALGGTEKPTTAAGAPRAERAVGADVGFAALSTPGAVL